MQIINCGVQIINCGERVRSASARRFEGVPKVSVLNKLQKHIRRVMRTPDVCLCKNKGADQLAVTAKLISAFVFATWIVQCCHASGKSQGNLKIFKVKKLSANFANCQEILNFW